MTNRSQPNANFYDTGFICAFALARMFHQGRARVGRQRTAAQLNRVRSARYKLDLALEAKKVSIHVVFLEARKRPGEICGLVSTLK
jgi:hypothetical protein